MKILDWIKGYLNPPTPTPPMVCPKCHLRFGDCKGHPVDDEVLDAHERDAW